MRRSSLKLLLLACILLVVAILGFITSSDSTAPPMSQQTAQAFLERGKVLLERRDVDGMISLFTSDARIMGRPPGQIRSVLDQTMHELGGNSLSVKFSQLEVKPSGDGAAISVTLDISEHFAKVDASYYRPRFHIIVHKERVPRFLGLSSREEWRIRQLELGAVSRSTHTMIDGLFAIDYQVHSLRSHDGKATVRQQCQRAVEIGLNEIGFSEHKDFDPDDPVVDYFDYTQYADEVADARAEFAGRLTIRMGVEIDYQKWFEERIVEYLADHAFDFVIGSVHYVDRAMLMTPAYLENRSKEQAHRDYYQAVLDSVESGFIDIVGHLEYANRRGVGVFGPFDPTPYRSQVSELFDVMIGRAIALEINTAGLRQGVGATYPCEEHVALYAQRGGRLLTIGSDSHDPVDLADRYGTAAEVAIRYGLDDVTVWSGRQPQMVPLRHRTTGGL